MYGFSRVRLVWTHGTCRIHWACGSGARAVLQIRVGPGTAERCPLSPALSPGYVLFDAWYPSKALLKRIRDDGWYFVCRLKKIASFNGHAVRTSAAPCWAEIGRLSGGLQVRVVRYGAKYYAADRLALSAVEVRRHDRVRAQIEEVMHGQDELGLGGCQDESERAQQHHVACCAGRLLCAGAGIPDRGLRIYQLKRHLSISGALRSLPALERLRNTA